MEIAPFITLYLRTLREYRRIFITTLIVPLALPLFVLTIFTAVFSSVGNVGGVVTSGKYVAYAAPAAVLLAAMLGAATTAISTAVDMQTGYYDRMRMSPAGTRLALAARRAADMTRMVVFAVILTGAAAADGVHIANWPLTLALAAACAACWVVAYGGFALSACIRTASAEISQAFLPLLFPVLFMSTAFMPKERLPHWLQGIATLNPISYMCEVIRKAYAGSFDDHAAIRAVAGVVVVAVITQTLVTLARNRLRTE
jgi:ABC-2 type transport system permease protein